MIKYKPTIHLLDRRQEDPGGHRYSAGHAAAICTEANFVGVDESGCRLYHTL